MKILHLYHDIMNLYGEYANVSALERMLEKSGVKFTTGRLTLFDNADLGDYDFIGIAHRFGYRKKSEACFAGF